MYKIDDVGSTFISLPPNLQTTDNQCFCYALDRQMQRIKRLADKLTIWTDLDNVDPKYYDYLALCVRAPYYRSEYTDAQKLELIKTAIMSYRYAGTKKAVNQLINIIFDDAQFTPWYQYGGQPYHFCVRASDILTEDSTERFTNIIKKVKAARSIIDALQTSREYMDRLYVGAGSVSSIKPAAIKEEGIDVEI